MEKDRGIEGVWVWPAEPGEGGCGQGGLLWGEFWKERQTEYEMSR